MKEYSSLSEIEIKNEYKRLLEVYRDYCSKGLKLDLSRGKPNAETLDVSMGLLGTGLEREDLLVGGIDYRNYGILDGIPAAKKFFAELYGLRADDIIVGGNSSLQLMYDTLARAMVFGLYGSNKPWAKEEGLKWICITPGYDRHFRITELLGFELISVPMRADGPDMDMVESLVKDPNVKGIWCVPKYSNPTGNTYSDDVVRRLASMECAAPDFRIMWDNAYGVHDFSDDGDSLLDIFETARTYGNEDRIFYFASTSKITFPGGGVAIMAASENNRRQIAPYLGAQTIGFDKINQLRHLKFFGTVDNARLHMKKLGKVIGSKFDIVLSELSSLSGLGIAEWTEPRGGYFITLEMKVGKASRVYELMKGAGVNLTPAGATHPYGVDESDSVLRIAPTYPSDDELSVATKILIVAVRLAAIEKLING